MGDKVNIVGVEVIQGGLLQIDIFNDNTSKGDRIFIEPDVFFKMLGEAMAKNYVEYIRKEWDEIIEVKKEGV